MTNPKENDVYFEYSIVNADNNTEVYKSDMVPPDKSLPVKLYELLGSGTSNIKFVSIHMILIRCNHVHHLYITT